MFLNKILYCYNCKSYIYSYCIFLDVIYIVKINNFLFITLLRNLTLFDHIYEEIMKL